MGEARFALWNYPALVRLRGRGIDSVYGALDRDRIVLGATHLDLINDQRKGRIVVIRARAALYHTREPMDDDDDDSDDDDGEFVFLVSLF